MPRDYEEYDYIEEQKARAAAAKANLDAIIAHNANNDSVASLARSAYKYTSCGAAVGACLYDGEESFGKWIYGDELHKLKPNDVITALCVSSIVEGVEQTTETHVIDLFDEAYETPDDAVKAYDEAVEAVEKEAREIWDATHGCERCKQHWVDEGFGDGEIDGATPIWDECPECKGSGEII